VNKGLYKEFFMKKQKLALVMVMALFTGCATEKNAVPPQTPAPPPAEAKKGAPPAVDYVQEGNSAAGAFNFDKAIQEYTEAVKRDPKNAIAFLQRGKAHYASARGLLSVTGNFIEFTSTSKADELTEQDRLSLGSALEDLTQSITLGPTAQAYRYRGSIYSDMGDSEKAFADFNQAISTDPNYARAYNSRGIAYELAGDYNSAIADYSQAIKLDPYDSIAYYNRGNAYYGKGDNDKAIEDYTQAIKLTPNVAVFYNNRGNPYYYKRDYVSARADWEMYLLIEPNGEFAKQARSRLEELRLMGY
jgi:tetratricopeptide (TPR) repeat protein